MEKKLLILSIMSVALVACNDDSNDNKPIEQTIGAQYYLDHTDELMPLIEQCKNKISTAETVVSVENLYSDKDCEEVYRASGAIKRHSLDKELAIEAELGTSTWEFLLNKRKRSIEKWANYGNK